MEYIEAPTVYSGDKPSLFLAGGITGCPDWQSGTIPQLSDLDIAIFNPRRPGFPLNKSFEQIEWEYQHLRKATVISFWFCAEGLNAISLYELGAWSMTTKPILVGVHPHFHRRIDVEIQTRLTRPDVRVVSTLPDLIQQIRQVFA